MFAVITPQAVREALKNSYFGSIVGAQFQPGEMGCAQETLVAILDYLHREFVCPNFLESYLKNTDEEA